MVALSYRCNSIAALNIQTKNRTTYQAYLKNVDYLVLQVVFFFIFSRSIQIGFFVCLFVCFLLVFFKFRLYINLHWRSSYFFQILQ